MECVQGSRLGLGLTLALALGLCCALVAAFFMAWHSSPPTPRPLPPVAASGAPGQKSFNIFGQETLPVSSAAAGNARPWCAGRIDGHHADLLSSPPCNTFFECRGQRLVRLETCPGDGCFFQALQRCVYTAICICAPCATLYTAPTRAAQPLLTPRPYVQMARRMGRGWVSASGSRNTTSTEPGARAGARTMRGRTQVQHQRGQGRRMQRPCWGSGPDNADFAQLNALCEFYRSNMEPGTPSVFAKWLVPPNVRDFSSDSAIVCFWKPQVACRKGRVVGLVISNNGSDLVPNSQPLWGLPAVGQSIPPSFGNLTALEYLDLSYNGLYNSLPMVGLLGSVPRELSRLTKLTHLDLSYNSLQGPVLDTLAQLPLLQSVNLKSNPFSEALPTSLGRLQRLQSLDLSYNNFTGALPSSVSLLSALTTLQVIWAPVGGSLPQEMGALTQLLSLELHKTLIQGPIPDAFSNLSSLTSLTLQDMPLAGTMPSWWTALAQLKRLIINATGIGGPLPAALPHDIYNVVLSGSSLNGSIPDLCAALPALQYLDLSSNQLTGPFPAGLKNCPGLIQLKLGGNKLEGAFPPLSFAKFKTSLTLLAVGSNAMNGTVPRNLLQQLPALEVLDISDNRFSGLPPVISCNSPKVSEVNASLNQFWGDIGPVLRHMRSCQDSFYLGFDRRLLGGISVDLSHNRLTGGLPPGWEYGSSELLLNGNNISGAIPPPLGAVNMSRLSLAHNALVGGVPAALFQNCPSLRTLDLSGNALTGPLPQGPLHSTMLQALVLAGNSLSGAVGPAVGQLSSLTLLDLSWNNLSGTLPSELQALSFLQSLDLSSNQLSGNLSADLSRLGGLTRLSLAHNVLSGSIPLELAPPFLSNLTFLDLSHNLLEGPIPYSFGNSSNPHLLLNLSNNMLSGPVPGDSSGSLGSANASIANNSGLCGGAGYPPCQPEQPSQPLSTGAIVGIAAGAVVAVGLVGLIAWMVLQQLPKDEWRGGVMFGFEHLNPPLNIGHLLEGTGRFDEDHKLGQGGFGAVYRATWPDGSELAIKRLAKGSAQGHSEFKAEVQTLGRLRHRNVVRLLGAYLGPPPAQEHLIIYDFLPGGSLEKAILTSETMPVGSPLRRWDLRRNIALDIARGLKYLHHNCKPGIIHRDMKPANVLLDAELAAYVADFGLACEADLRRTHITDAGVMGTAGFVAPEYNTLGRLSFKSDVYAYGITLIQLFTGRRTSDEDICEKGLRRWAGNGPRVIDPNLVVDEVDEPLIMGIIQVGLMCTARVPMDRPTMEEVVLMLEDIEKFVQSNVQEGSPVQ